MLIELKLMVRNVLTALLFLLTADCFAQQNFFVLIQADNNQPFYARIKGTIYSSSDIGHLIIPQLKDTPQTITIGFPKKEYPEENFVINLNKKDQSFQLKNLEKKGWALFNTLTMELQMPVNDNTTEVRPEKNASAKTDPSKREDAFSRLMAGVVNDTSIMYNNSIADDRKKEIQADKSPDKPLTSVEKNISSEGKTGTVNTTNKGTSPEEVTLPKKEAETAKPETLNKQGVTMKAPLYRPKDTVVVQRNLSYVKIINEQKTDSSLRFRYVDIPNVGYVDTVDVIIPLISAGSMSMPKGAIFQKKGDISLADRVFETKVQKSADTIRTKIDTTVAITPKSDVNIKKDSIDVIPNKAAEHYDNKDCKGFASDYDIDKLRIKMLAIANDDDKIYEARTLFKIKCISVIQVKALSEVFKSDGGKYKLFDATYAYVSDKGNFMQLQSLLTDQYYINRFKAMIQ